MQRDMFRWQNVSLNSILRIEYVDYNVGEFEETGSNIFDHIYAIVPGISLRFSSNTSLRMNYQYHWETDILGNPTVKTSGWQFGFASYF